MNVLFRTKECRTDRAGIPMQVVKEGELVAECKGRSGPKTVNMMLLGRQPKGTWILTFLGSASEVLTTDEAQKIDNALDALEAVSLIRHASCQ